MCTSRCARTASSGSCVTIIDGRPVAVQFLEQFHDTARHLRVQIARGLVRQQQPGRAGQGARNCDALLLTAGELGRIMPRARGQQPTRCRDSWMRRLRSPVPSPR